MTTPLVSVIVPTYRRRALLREAVDSALAQTVSDIEVLVVITSHMPITMASLGHVYALSGRIDEGAGSLQQAVTATNVQGSAFTTRSASCSSVRRIWSRTRSRTPAPAPTAP